MTVAQPMLTPAQHHGNRQLFSDHYLDIILPGRADWQMLVPAAAAARGRIAAILADYQPSTNEAQTEHELVRPILEVLGHTFEVQAPLKTPDGTRKPDYVLYCDAAARTANKNQVLDDARLADRAFAVGEAKYWERPLDIALQAGGGDPFNNRNPSYQIAFYMQHAGTPWGLLTNGRCWRLYQRDTAHKLDRFYEVDLPGLAGPDATDDAFLYFYGFFRRAAFDPGPLSLDALLRESTDYARNVGEGLKAQVYEALRHLAQGFLDYGPNGLSVDPANLKTIYDHSLIVLYRLLFVFYAEARDLLPLRDSAQYRDSYSLRAMTHDVASALTAGRRLLSTSARLWPQLRELFGIINAGSPPLKVASFNGGLFDPSRYPFLERYIVGDGHLQAALDRLARVNGQFIDYRDLSERHLGTIYEGLLEHHLAGIAPEDGWTVDLFNDRGERKRTGSYYTPDAIVKYIVEQTVGPALSEAVTGIKDAQKQADAVLNINCLDPAMGSGHFLVEVVEHIARFLVDLGAPVEDARSKNAERPSSDLAHWKRRVAQSCVYGVDVNPLAVDLAKLSLWLSTAAKDRPLSFLDHHLRAGNSLVGARLADLGSAAPGGEGSVASALGEGRKRARRAARAAQAAQAAGQTSMLEDDAFRQSLSQAVDFMWLIEGNAGETVAQVKEQEQIYATLRETLARRYGRLADLATARRFGLQVDAGIEARLAEYAVGQSVARFPQFDALLDEAAALAERHRFFHWELEFPEVFFDKRGYALGEKAGFDVVVGNPPYVRQEQLAPYKAYFAQQYSEVYHGVADLSLYFIAAGIHLLKEDGRLAFITSGTFQKLASGAPLRRYLSEHTGVRQLVRFGEQQVFAEAITYPIILLLQRREPDGEELTVRELVDLAQLNLSGDAEDFPAPKGSASWVFAKGALGRIVAGWPKESTLRAIVGKPVSRGVSTGLNDAFVIDHATRNRLVALDPNTAQILKPYVRGEDLKPWYQEESGLQLLFVRRGTEIGDYPAALEHLSKFRDRLEPRPPAWSGEWKGRKPGSYAWFEIQDTVEYYQVFERPRLHSTKVSLYPSFSLVTSTMYAANTSYVVPFPDLPTGYFLLALLNSHVAEYFFRTASSPKANGYYELQPSGLEVFPIPTTGETAILSLTSPAADIAALARARYTLHRQIRHRILSDLGEGSGKLNLKLTAWWELTFPAFRAELGKVFHKDIPLKQRDEWEAWLADQRAEHERLTAEIVRLETALNAQVYELFDLTKAEIKIIEESTKYRYGKV